MSEPSAATPTGTVSLVVDGRAVEVRDHGGSLLGALRDQLGVRSAKDGCSPQGQCGCCTVLVDGQPRVSCVTPLRRVAGRTVTTVDGLDPAAREAWASAMCATGGSQCGFCTPGIIVRLEGLRAKGGDLAGPAVERALQAHLCRCTGWQTITEAAALVAAGRPDGADRDLDAAARRAALEGGAPQAVGPEVALGRGGFADDTAPDDALVAVRDAAGAWVVGESVEEARRAAGKVQGRRTTVAGEPPLTVPEGEWAASLRTSWVEPAYLETDATWCAPGGRPVSSLANGGAFGAKDPDHLAATARALADEHGRPVRVLWSREDVVRLGPKRPPFAGGARADGSGAVVVARTPGIAAAIAGVAPDLAVTEVGLAGPPTSAAVRAAGWAEAAVAVAALGSSPDRVVAPNGATAAAEIIDVDGREQVRVSVRCGRPLDAVVLRSYCVGAAHMALGWVRSEALAVDQDGTPLDLTIRSFGILRAVDTPPIEVTIEPDDGEPVNGSDAVFAAVAAAAWRAAGHPGRWPAGVQ
ncbi:MAG: hypothetical protein KDB04_05935, partial [Acidimicrobiales bacterium]|nr:hypothetical protein [Acidimicrobiales bacterium]